MNPARLIFLASVSVISLSAWGDPADYVKVPAIESGEREIEAKYGSGKLAGGEGRESAGTFGFGYGVTPYWFTEAYVKYQKTPDEHTRFDAVEWENKLLLTETGKYPVDVGFFVELEVPRMRSEGYEVRFGPLFQADAGNLQLNGNLFLKRQYRAVPEADNPHVTELHYQMQVKYRLIREFEFGLQAFGELGKWDRWDAADKQNHRIGPAVFGKLPLGGRESVHYDMAWLIGASRAAPDSTLRLQLEYEF